jgi:YD repeat-containing protein
VPGLRNCDSLNPESGTINYDYYDNGNLWHKTDARGVVTTFTYDGLNRVVTRTYSGPAPGGTTPAVTYTYDTLGAALNGKGRLTSVRSSVSTYSYGSYDVVGRIVTGTQTTDGQNYAMSYQ